MPVYHFSKEISYEAYTILLLKVEESIPVSINLPTDASHQVKSVIAPPEPRSNAIDGGSKFLLLYFTTGGRKGSKPEGHMCALLTYLDMSHMSQLVVYSPHRRHELVVITEKIWPELKRVLFFPSRPTCGWVLHAPGRPGNDSTWLRPMRVCDVPPSRVASGRPHTGRHPAGPHQGLSGEGTDTVLLLPFS